MEIFQDNAKRLVQVWITNEEAEDETLQNQLQSRYADWKEQKFMVAVFYSGKRSLQEDTLSLLKFNKKRFAELAVQKSKMLQS